MCSVLLPVGYLQDIRSAALWKGVNLDCGTKQSEARNEPLAGNGWILKPKNPYAPASGQGGDRDLSGFPL